MNPQFTQPAGSVSKETNKDSIARKFGCKKSEVVYAKTGQALTGYKVIYDKVTQRSYALPSNIPAGATITSLTDGILVHSAGNFDLGALAVLRGEYVTLVEDFTSGFTIKVKNEVVSDGTNLYRWGGALPKIVNAGSTIASTGGVGSWIAVTQNPMEYVFDTVDKAKAATLPIGSTVKVKSKIYQVGVASDLSPATAPVITMTQGTVLRPISGFIRKEVGQTVTFSTVTEVAAQFNLITDRSIQGVTIDAIDNKILFAFNKLSSETTSEGGIFYEYNFNRETGVVGSFIRTFTDIPSGHSDYFAIVHTNSGRKLLFSEPSGDVWASGYYISSVDLDAATPSTTVSRLLDFTADGPRALVSAWNNDLIIQRVGKTVARCKASDILAGNYSPVETHGWGYLLNMVETIIPEQNLQAHPEPGVFWGLCGYDSRFKNHSCISSGENGVNTSATFFDNATQYELEAICFYWKDSENAYKPYIVLQDIVGHNLVTADVISSLSTSQAIWRKQSFVGTGFSQYLGNSSYMFSPMPVAVNGLAIGGHTLGSTDSYNPTDFIMEQWANNATRRSSRLQLKAPDSTKITQMLWDESRDTVYGQSVRISFNDGTKTWQAMQLKPGKVFIGGYEQISSATYYAKLNILNADSDDRVAIYLNTSTSKPQIVSGAVAPTLATTANTLKLGSWNNTTAVFAPWLDMNSSGYTWSIPAASARKLKKDFDYDIVKGLEVVLKMKPLAYTLKSDESRRMGFLADEAYEADPLLANLDEDGEASGIWEHAHLAQLVRAVQQLYEQNQEMRKELDELKSK